MHKLFPCWFFLLASVIPAASDSLAGGAEPAQSRPGRVVLTTAGATDYVIVVPPDASEPEKFAAFEIARYVRAISGAALEIRQSGERPARRIRIEKGDSLGLKLKPEGYAIAVRDDDVILAADTGRASLFAAYDLLERLGCRWLAPQFAFYDGEAELVPKNSDLALDLPTDVVEAPDFKVRKLDIEEGLSHTAENLKQLVEWAPKLRYNTLMVPRDYGGRGRVTWDAWRDAVTPEARKRGLIIEVGGHGYENFLNAGMQDGKLFADHPEWFGRKESGTRSKAKKQVFCTSNADAVDFVTRGVLEYLGSRPEIEVFELWPPDGADWCTCDACHSLGEPQDRQALLVNHVQAALDKARPGVRLEIIAYSKALLPPTKVKLDERILVDFCPINQCFEVPINDPSSDRNADYVAAVTAWRKQFAGDIGLYSYYRKYAWKSLPALIPHYMQADLRYYRSLPLQATMIYAEPGDWGTYEMNHYALGKLSWDADADVPAMLRDFSAARYGGDRAEQMANAMITLGDTVRTVGSLPFTGLKTPEQIEVGKKTLSELAKTTPKDSPAFLRAQLAFDYAIRDLNLQALRATQAPEADLRKAVETLLAFLTTHKDEGVFILTGRNDLDRFLKRYGLPARAIEPGE